jgi:hypothetical protein
MTFDRADGPVVFEDIVSIVWGTMGLTETQHFSVEESDGKSLVSKDRNIEEQLDIRQSLQILWEGICSMPVRHRRALLLNLTDGRGDNLIAYLPILGIASIRAIAEALVYEPQDFAALWPTLPLDDLTIADRMGLTRQQVINLRQSARASLRRRLQ